MSKIDKKVYKHLGINYDDIDFELDEAFEQGLINLKNIEIEEYNFSNIPINEEPVSIAMIISLTIAAPTLIKAIAKAIGFLYKKIRKVFGKSENEPKTIEKLVNFTEKWHNAYVTTLKYLLKGTGIFKKAGVSDPKTQQKVAETVFYVIIFGFAIHGGIASFNSINHAIAHASVDHATVGIMETALTQLKLKEVKHFISSVVSA